MPQFPGRWFRSGRRTAGPRPGALHTAFGIVALLALFYAVTDGTLSRAWAFLDRAAGVLALVSLTATVLWGLAATDRIVLGPIHRLLAQGVHRGTAVAGLGFLGLHVWVKVASEVTGVRAAAVPLTDEARPVLIGLGTVAGYLFVAVAVTGAVRAAFARGGHPRWWRALHMCAYPAWGAALVHGLRSGRHASAWVTVAYALCLVGVAAVLAHRLAPGNGGSNSPRAAAGPASPDDSGTPGTATLPADTKERP
ncbi:hypothetical protein [Streptomyces iconiensis]|uniref:DMSO/TMAO reductase YedYZ, heme-binding membrane subunit n=1 Tax=Streptomyces iconiensis TaxID=1384038 RepID=A0ABT6ZTL2_9ACTN|nr:hypothetical protein [Streptomyces iconiensis]MDJ1132400.1 hypothetical protein [Streptomyces iconiensis]